MSWKEKPTLLSKIIYNENYGFMDESGCITDLKSINKKIEKGEKIEIRDSIFVINSIFIKPYSLRKIISSVNKLKKKYFERDDIVLHSTEINNRKNEFANLTDDKYYSFCSELNDIILKNTFYQMTTGINKKIFVEKMIKFESFDEGKITRIVYNSIFRKIDYMLKNEGKKATLVVEESSNPDLDKLIVKILFKLKMKKKITNIKSMYFVSKKAFYPSGSEIADLTARPIYKVYQNVEFVSLLKKLYKFPKGKYNSLQYIYYDESLLEKSTMKRIKELVK